VLVDTYVLLPDPPLSVLPPVAVSEPPPSSNTFEP